MEGIGQALGSIFATFIIIALIVGGIIVGLIVYLLNNDTELRVKQPMEPSIEITIIDGVSDTTYVYDLTE